MFKSLVSISLVSLVTTFAVAASATPVLSTCPATGTLMTSADCAKATQDKLNVCQASKDDCTKTAPKAPPPDIACLENPGNAGKIRRTGKYSCTCDDPSFHVALASYGAQRCYVTVEPLLVDELARLRKLLADGSIGREEFNKLKEQVEALAPEKFVSKTDFDAALGNIDGRLKKVEGDVATLKVGQADHEKRITALEKSSPATHPPFSVIPEVGVLVVSRSTSGAFVAPDLGLRLRYNAASSPWFFTFGGKAAYGSSQGNGASYAYQGQLGFGAYLGESRKVSLEVGPYAQVHTADMVANLPGGITTNGRGHAIGGYAGFDWRIVGGLNLRLEGGLGSGIDNVVNPSAAYPGGPHASKRSTAFQPYGGLSIGYAFDF